MAAAHDHPPAALIVATLNHNEVDLREGFEAFDQVRFQLTPVPQLARTRKEDVRRLRGCSCHRVCERFASWLRAPAVFLLGECRCRRRRSMACAGLSVHAGQQLEGLGSGR